MLANSNTYRRAIFHKISLSSTSSYQSQTRNPILSPLPLLTHPSLLYLRIQLQRIYALNWVIPRIEHLHLDVVAALQRVQDQATVALVRVVKLV